MSEIQKKNLSLHDTSPIAHKSRKKSKSTCHKSKCGEKLFRMEQRGGGGRKMPPACHIALPRYKIP